MKNKCLATLGLSTVLIGAVLTAQAGVITADLADGMLEKREIWDADIHAPNEVAFHNDTDWQYSIGEWYNGNPAGGLATTVIPFELPNLGAISNPFITADLGVMLNPNSTPGAATDIDLYAVRVDASPLISTSDWYNGAAPDPSATLIQASFMTGASVGAWDGAPNHNTDAAGDAILTSYLNAAYNGGAGVGDFVFLRLSYGSDSYAAGWDTYNLNSADAGGEGERPVITYEAIPEPATLGLLGLAGLGLWIRRKFRV